MPKQKDKTFSVRASGVTWANTKDWMLALYIAQSWLDNHKTVSVIDNKTGKTVERYCYGHRQKVVSRPSK